MSQEYRSVTVRAHPNIAFIKYWGNRDHHLRLPVNASISMNLDGLYTQTAFRWQPELTADQLVLNGVPQDGAALRRVAQHLDVLRERLGLSLYASVESANNFPTGAGIASSASGFAALTLAAVSAANVTMSERELSTYARIGSGSASRSVPGGFVEWYAGDSHETSFAESVAGPGHWDIVDVIAVVSQTHKAVGSREGHQSADTSDLQAARVAGAAARLDICRAAILQRDFSAFAEVVEYDSNLMHAVMMTSRPPLFYWEPVTLTVMNAVRQWRESEGLRVCYTLDAGPNVHCICVREDSAEVSQRLQALSGVQDIFVAGPGGPAHIMVE